MSEPILKLLRIHFDKPNLKNSVPTYQNPMVPKRDFTTPDLEVLFEQNENELLDIAYSEAVKYLNDDSLCNDDEGMFPQKSKLSGEFYLSSVVFENHSFCAITFNFLEQWNGRKDDYLGLEIVFLYDNVKKEFLIREVNSSSI